jgi:hypothetical protein
MTNPQYWRDYRQQNRDTYRAKSRDRAAKRYAEKRVWIASLKSAVGCQSCGERFYGALDFHHRDPDLKAIPKNEWRSGGSGAWLTRSEEWVFSELAKCVVLCCTCHRKAHAGLIDIDAMPQADFSAISETMELLAEVPRMYEGRVGAKRKTD